MLLCDAVRGTTLADAAAVMPRYPQAKHNLPRAGRGPLPQSLLDAVDRVNDELNGDGRVLVRPSGTEPVVRVLAEAPTKEESEALCGTVVELVREELG